MIPEKGKLIEVLREVVYFPKGDNIINLKMVDDIELKENCKLNFKSGSNLYVYGYITGPLTSEVTMNSGSTVKEVFQVKDWRGGTATSQIVLVDALTPDWLGGQHRVFLIGQYYVQNVEVPLVIRKGASEVLEAGISDLADMDVDFIVSNTTTNHMLLFMIPAIR